MVTGWRLTGTDGMKETIRIGKETGIRVVGSHIKAKGPSTWGHSTIDILLIERARREGVQVYLDQYPYETFGGGPTGVIPPWVPNGETPRFWTTIGRTCKGTWRTRRSARSCERTSST
jgi:N-acyl-D-amino-acid deacylase